MAGLRAAATFAGAFAGALILTAAPCSAQALNLNPYGLALDPYDVFPPGPAEGPPPALPNHRARRHHRHLSAPAGSRHAARRRDKM